MGFSVDKVAEKTLRLKITFAGERMNVDYHAGKKAHEMEKKLQESLRLADEVEDPNAARKELIEALVLIVADWDVEMDGKKVPLKHEALYALPLPTVFFAWIAQRIGEDLARGGSLKPV